jgi:hypothetical protein
MPEDVAASPGRLVLANDCCIEFRKATKTFRNSININLLDYPTGALPEPDWYLLADSEANR